jgi:V-type H+-transporting ATPase subunit D
MVYQKTNRLQSSRLKKVQGKKKRDTANRDKVEEQLSIVEDSDDTPANLLNSKDEDVIF